MDASIDTPTAAPLIWPKSACNLCDINCGVELGVSGDGAAQRIVKVRGDADNPRSRGYLCNKAQAIPSQVHHRDRLTTPLRRRADGGHEPIDWDTAVREIAERLGAVVAARGGKTVAAFGGGGQGNHAGGSYAFGFLRALGSRTVFNALAQEKTGDLWLNGLLNARPTHRRHILQPYPTPMHPMSITSVFTNNRSQAVRLPADVRLPEGVKKVQVRARGVDRIISPVGQTWNEFFLNGPQASDDFMAERASQQQSGREAF